MSFALDRNEISVSDLVLSPGGEHAASEEQLSAAQLTQLVRLLDNSDVSELEVKRASEGIRLILRKAVAASSQEVVVLEADESVQKAVASADATHTVTAALVGIFHPWAKPKGKPLVAVGDRIKVGQLVGTIQSLNVINEVESPFAGRITELLVQEGQAVEYGQALMTLESGEES